MFLFKVKLVFLHKLWFYSVSALLLDFFVRLVIYNNCLTGMYAVDLFAMYVLSNRRECLSFKALRKSLKCHVKPVRGS